MADTLLVGTSGENGTAAPVGGAAEDLAPQAASAAGEPAKTPPPAQGGEQKAQEGAKPDAGKGDQAKADTAPADIEVKLPEGVEADPELLGALKGVAKESGLKGEQAQKLADAYVAAQRRAEEKGRAGWEQQQKAWVEELRADKDLGGAQFDASVKVAQRAMTRFGSPELSKLLNDTGLGNHPELVRLAVRVGKVIAEDSVAGTTSSGSQAGGEQELHRQMYPSMFTKE